MFKKGDQKTSSFWVEKKGPCFFVVLRLSHIKRSCSNYFILKGIFSNYYEIIMWHFLKVICWQLLWNSGNICLRNYPMTPSWCLNKKHQSKVPISISSIGKAWRPWCLHQRTCSLRNILVGSQAGDWKNGEMMLFWDKWRAEDKKNDKLYITEYIICWIYPPHPGCQ